MCLVKKYLGKLISTILNGKASRFPSLKTILFAWLPGPLDLEAQRLAFTPSLSLTHRGTVII